MTPWDDARIETLKRVWGFGLSAAQVAAVLGDGITRNAVIGKAYRLRLPRQDKPWPRPAPRRKPPEPAKLKLKPRLVAPIAPRPKPASRPRPLFELSDEQCRWMVDDKAVLFCADPVEPRRPYCPFHMRASRHRC